MDKISVQGFCKSYKDSSKGNDKMLIDFLKKHIVKDYVPFLEKDVICTSIINATCKVKDGEYEFIKINSVGRYIIFVMRLIDLYTDIQIDFNDVKYIEQYDELNQIGAIDSIISTIPKAEYTEFSTILNMKLDDFRDNEYSIAALFYNLKNTLFISEEAMSSVLKEIIKQKQNNE